MNKSNNIECPICNEKAPQFLPFGVVKRNNALCPKCHSLERHRLLWLYLKSRTNILSRKLSILHFAPENCLKNTFKTMNSVEYISADLFDKNASLKMDVTDIKFPDNSFDLIICNHVLEHVENDKKAITELFRVLKPSGIAVLLVPVDNKREITY
jgi:SAM-dependent methyltransferase